MCASAGMQNLAVDDDQFGRLNLSVTEVKYSSAHQGFLLYLVRLLRPFWNKTLLVSRQLPFSTPQLLYMHQLLSNLRDLIASS